MSLEYFKKASAKLSNELYGSQRKIEESERYTCRLCVIASGFIETESKKQTKKTVTMVLHKLCKMPKLIKTF